MGASRRNGPVTRTQVLAGYLEKTLLPDLRERAKEPALLEALTERWQYERAQKQTAAALPEWVDLTLTQVAVAWVLSTVFVRVLEDRGLLSQRRVAGGDAAESERLFHEVFPGLGSRDYLAAVFAEVAHAPVARELLGRASNPAFLAPPSHEAVRMLFERLRDADASGKLILRFDDPDTRFLGDLYQDLSVEVRERYALLQTPDFVESFILDRTLEPAIATFGLHEVRVIDPTCGSGHFLLGSFRRLVEHLRVASPARDLRDIAREALGKVHGSDINPYAVAIARFRLLLAYLELCKVRSLSEAPELEALTHNVVVADSLLLGAEGDRHLMELALTADDQSVWGPRAFGFVDPPAVNHVFRQRYHAVVGNPPYIVCRDAALRETYRAGYPESAKGKYALAAPFTERFFKLAVAGGYVGLINANSFMKREFGKGLVEKVLPRFDATAVVDTSGAYIPGHGTPTVILLGRHRAPESETVRAVLGRRGEPETPENPATGKVWSSIVGHIDEVGYEDEYVTVAEVKREMFRRHPWSLGGGGSGDLQEVIASRCSTRMTSVVDSIGVDTITRASELLELDRATFQRLCVEEEILLDYVSGEEIRDWSLAAGCTIPVPHDRVSWRELPSIDHLPGLLRFLWPHRDWLGARWVSGGTRLSDVGKPYWIVPQLPADKHATPLSIAFAFVATHNHFLLDRGGKVFKQSAPLIKLPATATENDHLALLAWLNSSTACFWMKQVCMNKGATSDHGVLQDDPERFRFEFDGSKLLQMPVPPGLISWRDGLLVEIARNLTKLGDELSGDTFGDIFRSAKGPDDLAAILHKTLERRAAVRRIMANLQEELDWAIYELLHLLPADDAAGTNLRLETIDSSMEVDPDERAYRLRGRTETPRLRAMTSHQSIDIIEQPEFKRRWFRSAGAYDAENVTDDQLVARAARVSLLDRLEKFLRAGDLPMTVSELSETLHSDATAQTLAAVCFPDAVDPLQSVASLIADDSVPYLAALRHTETGLAKRARWEHTWALQRREDAGERVGEIPVPPKYDREDYRDGRYWPLRGKLDVPRERFIAYPGAEADERAPLFGWAGWDHLARARALASLYQRRKTEDGWDRERLRPLLAGLQELLPWLLQWHDEPDPELDGMRQGQVWMEFLEGERASLGWSEEDLRAWRPAVVSRGKGAAKKPAKPKRAKAEAEEAPELDLGVAPRSANRGG